MRTALITPEEQHRILDRYRNDPVIKHWCGLMARVMAIAPVQYKLTFDDEGRPLAESILDSWTQKQLDDVEKALKDYCRSTYPELYETDN